MARAESKRQILLLTNDLGPHSGGIETFLLGLLDQLPGKNIVIYTSKEDGSEAFDFELTKKTGVKVIRDKRKTLLPTPRLKRNVEKVISENSCEIVWFGAAAPLAIMAGDLKKFGIKKTIAMTHGHEVWWAKIPPFNFAMRKIGKGCDVVTHLGSYTKNAIRGSLGSNPKLVQIAPGIDTKKFKPAAKSKTLLKKYGIKNEPVIVSVGRLVKRKGPDQLIKAFKSVKLEVPNAKLLFVGEGKFRFKLEKLAEKGGFKSDIIFTGRVAYKDLPDYFRLGDVFAMPSRSRFFGLVVEGLGIVYLEASACGIPVIVGKSGGTTDALKDGKTGFLVNSKDTDDIATKLVKILKGKNQKTLGKNGRDWVSKEWTWKIWGSRFSKLLSID